MGFPFDECGIGHEVIGRQYSGHSDCSECCGGAAATTEDGGGLSPWQTTERVNRRSGREARRTGSGPAAVQCVQDSTHAKPCEASHWRGAGGNMGILEWATSPL